jgi:hypothetical protein
LRKGISPFVASVLLVLIGIVVCLAVYSFIVVPLKSIEPTFATVSMKVNDRFEYNLVYLGFIGTSFPIQNTYVFLDTSGPLSANHEIYVHLGEKFRVNSGFTYHLIDFHEGYDKVSSVDVARVVDLNDILK